MEYARVFGEETVPYLRDLGEEAQESAGWRFKPQAVPLQCTI